MKSREGIEGKKPFFVFLRIGVGSPLIKNKEVFYCMYQTAIL